jgi:hypothetical protein
MIGSVIRLLVVLISVLAVLSFLIRGLTGLVLVCSLRRFAPRSAERRPPDQVSVVLCWIGGDKGAVI